MSAAFDFEAAAGELLRKAIKEFAAWAATNWTITKAEVETLTKPTTAPAEYARGYNDAIRSICDAAELWAEGDL